MKFRELNSINSAKSTNGLTRLSPLMDNSSVTNIQNMRNKIKDSFDGKLSYHRDPKPLYNFEQNDKILKATSFNLGIPSLLPPELSFQVAQSIKSQHFPSRNIEPVRKAMHENHLEPIQVKFQHRSGVKELEQWLQKKLQNPPKDEKQSVEYKNQIMQLGIKELIRMLRTRCVDEANLLQEIWQLTWRICQDVILHLSKNIQKLKHQFNEQMDTVESLLKSKMTNVKIIDRSQELQQAVKKSEDEQKVQLRQIKQLKQQLSNERDHKQSYEHAYIQILEENLRLHAGCVEKREWVIRQYEVVKAYKNKVAHKMRTNIRETAITKARQEGEELDLENLIMTAKAQKQYCQQGTMTDINKGTDVTTQIEVEQYNIGIMTEQEQQQTEKDETFQQIIVRSPEEQIGGPSIPQDFVECVQNIESTGIDVATMTEDVVHNGSHENVFECNCQCHKNVHASSIILSQNHGSIADVKENGLSDVAENEQNLKLNQQIYLSNGQNKQIFEKQMNDNQLTPSSQLSPNMVSMQTTINNQNLRKNNKHITKKIVPKKRTSLNQPTTLKHKRQSSIQYMNQPNSTAKLTKIRSSMSSMSKISQKRSNFNFKNQPLRKKSFSQTYKDMKSFMNRDPIVFKQSIAARRSFIDTEIMQTYQQVNTESYQSRLVDRYLKANLKYLSKLKGNKPQTHVLKELRRNLNTVGLQTEKNMQTAIQKHLIPVILEELKAYRRLRTAGNFNQALLNEYLRNMQPFSTVVLKKFAQKYGVKMLAHKNLRQILRYVEALRTKSLRYEILYQLLDTPSCDGLFIYLTTEAYLDPSLTSLSSFDTKFKVIEDHEVGPSLLQQIFLGLTINFSVELKKPININELHAILFDKLAKFKKEKYSHFELLFQMLSQNGALKFETWCNFICSLDLDINKEQQILRNFLYLLNGRTGKYQLTEDKFITYVMRTQILNWTCIQERLNRYDGMYRVSLTYDNLQKMTENMEYDVKLVRLIENLLSEEHTKPDLIDLAWKYVQYLRFRQVYDQNVKEMLGDLLMLEQKQIHLLDGGLVAKQKYTISVPN